VGVPVLGSRQEKNNEKPMKGRRTIKKAEGLSGAESKRETKDAGTFIFYLRVGRTSRGAECKGGGVALIEVRENRGNPREAMWA